MKLTGDSDVITEAGIVKKDSNATTIYLTSVTVNGNEIKLSNVPFTIKTKAAVN